ncbi:innexin shaking-B-like [Amphibalanus amphitrite]|uniref:innexin shaking-B-like n=1 Tax=Amphibalanus amphitrite TaxID=1232801 RepID=UPI001C8FE540|nr:innexin shaking-B-like [Amphibalanus amphitrite]XP_043229521.1 innexin shaking-B-like [Amphibalanus amphitrite]
MAITSLMGDVAMTIKGKMPGQVNIDNKVFQLHYRLTTFLFLGFSILSTTTSLIGHPINCFCRDCEEKGISKEVIDTHCWITGTYTLPNKSAVTMRKIGFESHFYGLGTQEPNEYRKYHLYYQWVPFVLFIQGVLFYLPHWMWEINEDGRVHALVHDMRLPNMDKDTLKKKIGNLSMYVNETLGSYDGYYLRFLLCDFLNIVNVFANMFLIDHFINHEFLTYGPRCARYFQDPSKVDVSPLTFTFPKLTKCEFQLYGVSGTVQNLDALCVLALNILNEKVYLFLWFWLVILSCITCVVFFFRTSLMFVKRFRVPLFQRRAHTLRSQDIKDVVRNIKVGDFFFLSLLAKNLDITAFRMFLAHLARAMRKQGGLGPAARSAQGRRLPTGGHTGQSQHQEGHVARQSARDGEAAPLAPKEPAGNSTVSTAEIVAYHLNDV